MEAVPGFDPDHHFFNPLGEPISLDEWARRFENIEDRILREDTIGHVTVRTVYLGFVDPTIYDARLFGTALVLDGQPIQQIQVYDSEEEALLGHLDHIDAVALGHHCHCCRVGEPHTD